MTKLNHSAKSALDALQERHTAYMVAKATIEAELKRELETRINSIRQSRNMALRLAAEAGVPKSQLGKAIGTSNYRTVQDILDETSSVFQSDANDNSLMVELASNGLRVTIARFGDNQVSGSAVLSIGDSGLEYVEGDPFVLPQVLRAGKEREIIEWKH